MDLIVVAQAIVKRGTEFLDAPVSFVGTASDKAAIAVLATAVKSHPCIDDAGQGNGNKPGRLDELQLLRWAVMAHAQGTENLIVDSDRHKHFSADKQYVVVIEEKLAGFAKSWTRDVLQMIQKSTGNEHPCH